MSSEFELVTFEGKTFSLTSQPELSLVTYPGCREEIDDGDLYTSEWEAPAEDIAGDKFTVVWHFETVKGGEPEDNSDWPWDDDHVVEVKMR